MRPMRGLGVYRGTEKGRRSPYWLAVKQPDGRRPKVYFESEAERDKAFTAREAEIRAVGQDAMMEVSTNDRHMLAEMKRTAERYGVSPMTIFERGIANLSPTLRDVKFASVSSQFLDEQEQRFLDGKIGERRVKEIRNMVARFNGSLGSAPLAAFDRGFVKRYLAGLRVSAQTRVNTAKNLAFILGWCVAEGMLQSNPVPEQEGVQRIPAVFTNEQVNELFEVATAEFPSLIPVLAVQWYAGLRPGASHGLRWEHVDFENGRIIIMPATNKTRQPDIVEDLPPSVFGWLLPHRKESGPIAQPGHIDVAKALHARLGYHGITKGGTNNPWPSDVARHTFASNLHALYGKDRKRVQSVMLHATSLMLVRHYLVRNIPLIAAEAYFARYAPLFPSK